MQGWIFHYIKALQWQNLDEWYNGFPRNPSAHFCFIGLKSDDNCIIGVWLISSILSTSHHTNLVTCNIQYSVVQCNSVQCSATWWRHQMETFSALLAICAGNSPVSSEFPPQRPVTQSFDIFFDLRLNKWLSKQSWGWWFEMLSCQYDVIVMVQYILQFLTISCHWRVLSSLHAIINSSRPGQNGRHFAENIFRCIFVLKVQLTLTQHWFR